MVQLLKEHGAESAARIAELEAARRLVHAKIDFYEGRIWDVKLVWALAQAAG